MAPQPGAKQMKLTKRGADLLRAAIMQGGRISRTSASGTGPQGGSVRGGHGVIRSARLLVKAGLLTENFSGRDEEYKRGRKVSYSTYTYTITEAGRRAWDEYQISLIGSGK